MVILPGTVAATKAALREHIADKPAPRVRLGVVIALTIPAITLASVWLPGPLILGLGPRHLVLRALAWRRGS